MKLQEFLTYSTVDQHIVCLYMFKMKLFILAAVVVVSVLAAPDIETLDDNFDFTPLSTNQLKEVSMCICGDGKCSDRNNSYKKHYPAIVIEACKTCNPSQKHIIRVFYDLLRDKLPEELKRCKDKYDPKGLYWDNFYSAVKDF